ncbi:MAG: hypothetical protein ACKO7W_15005 [Elainella sp.]
MSGRYQSKVFNYVSRQSLRLRDRTAQTWRQTKIGLVWTVQVLLYPVYAAFQATRLVNQQLQQAVRQAFPQLQASPVDTAADQPIRAALRSVSTLEVRLLKVPAGLPAVLTHALKQPARSNVAEVLIVTHALSAPVQIQGLASVRETGHLALVTTQNQVLDILSLEQQSQLSQRLVWELANYWHERRYGKSLPSPASGFLPLPRPQHNALPPIRAFRNLMAWMQRSAVAASADLFQESQLSLVSGTDQPTWTATEAEFYDWLAQTRQFTGRLLRASWESGKVGLSKRSLPAAIQTFQTTLPQIPAALPPHPTNPLPADWILLLDQWLSQIPGLKAEPILLTGQPGDSSQDLSDLYVPDLKPLYPVGTHIDANQDLSDLNRQPPSVEQPRRPVRQLRPNQPQQLAPANPEAFAVWASPTASREAIDWEVVDTAAIESTIKGQSQLTNRQTTKPSTLDEWDADHGLNRPRRRQATYDAPLTSLDTANEEEAAMLPNSWIETEAQLVGYEKHPLEQILEWLDRGMVWIESKLARLWRWLNRPLS